MGRVWRPSEILSGTSAPRELLAIDACMQGWLAGITAHRNEDDPLKPHRGLCFLDEGDRDLLRITLEDADELAAGELFCEVDRARGVYVTKTSGRAYDLSEIIRAEVAWRMKDPGTDALARLKNAELRYLRDYSMHYAARLLEAFERLFWKLREAECFNYETAGGGAPLSVPVCVEGGLHLVARCVAEAARTMGFPVFAFENTWLPGYMILTPETGAAVNRWALLYDRARAVIPPDLDLVDEIVTRELAQKADLSWYRRAYPWLYPVEISEEEKAGQELEEIQKLKGAFEHPEIPVVCFLGQVPYDASVTMDNPDGVTPAGLFEKLATKTRGQVVFLYRSHPMEEPSAITGLTESDRLRMVQEKHGGRLVVIDGGRLPLLHHLEAAADGYEPTIWGTVNSQAGLEVARYFDVEVAGRAFYEAAGVTSRLGGLKAGGLDDPEERREKWLRFVRWLVQRVYVRRDHFDERLFTLETRRHLTGGFEVYDTAGWWR